MKLLIISGSFKTAQKFVLSRFENSQVWLRYALKYWEMSKFTEKLALYSKMTWVYINNNSDNIVCYSTTDAYNAQNWYIGTLFIVIYKLSLIWCSPGF